MSKRAPRALSSASVAPVRAKAPSVFDERD
jgi:hypothetical protein